MKAASHWIHFLLQPWPLPGMYRFHVRHLAIALMTLGMAHAAPAYAKPLIADISDYRIEITSQFTGTHLLLFGARNSSGDVIIVIRGPQRDFIVRRKERVAGIWINRTQMQFDGIPSFYAIAASRPLEDMRDTNLFDPLRLGIEHLKPAPTADTDTQLHATFWDALIAWHEAQSRYRTAVADVRFMGETLFKANIYFPDTTPRGTYTAEIYLFNDGRLVSMQSSPIEVYKTGFDAFVYDTAHDHPALYGLLAIVLAASAGWGASRLFARLSG